jgi:hypothetical protein
MGLIRLANWFIYLSWVLAFLLLSGTLLWQAWKSWRKPQRLWSRWLVTGLAALATVALLLALLNPAALFTLIWPGYEPPSPSPPATGTAPTAL